MPPAVDHLFDIRPERPGFRLHRLEVLNWGTFDSSNGEVYCLEPGGRTSLLVGQNGSGKSTLVDAILTLLVPSNIRNYNVAAGAKSTERSEKSYIRGDLGRSSDEAQQTVMKCLRPKGNHLSAISCVFRDEQLDRAFTLCQVLHLAGDGAVDKIFALADDSRQMAVDLSGVRTSDAIRIHLQERGYQTAKTFIEYQGWVVKRTGMRGKAMDMLNQAVAVKDIPSLNVFIRRHMLEGQDWREKVDRLLTHFQDLSIAYQELVRAQKAEQLLTPVETIGARYRDKSAELDAAELRLRAADTFFQSEAIRLYEPEIARSEEDLAATLTRKADLSESLKAVAETIRKLKNKLEAASGQRLRDLPTLIKLEKALLETKRAALERFHEHLTRCTLHEEVTSREQFTKLRNRLVSLRTDTANEVNRMTAAYESSLADCGALRQQLRTEEAERQVLSQRQTNLPSHLATLRARLCEDLRIEESALPFAAELMAVAGEERRWEASTEMVLRSFALSLLVPERLYARVRTYVEKTKLADARGEGQRLVYLRIGKTEGTSAPGDRLHPQSLFRKLQFRSGHDLTPWIRDQVLRRFDYRCCESVDEFNNCPRLAMTQHRHIKSGEERHEKDDRPRAVDPRHYVLGWDNREKLRRIGERIDEIQGMLVGQEGRIAKQAATLEELRRQEDSIAEVLAVKDFNAIDVQHHQAEVQNLEREKRELENSNKAVRALNKRVTEAERQEEEFIAERDEMLKREQTLTDSIASGRRFVANNRQLIAAAKKAGDYERYVTQFSAIQQSLGSPVLSIDNLLDRQKHWIALAQRHVDSSREAIKPLVESLQKAMFKFLHEFKEEQPDLDATVQSLESFLGLLGRLRQEDLPKHEKKFKERLNDKVTQEVALFNMALRQECKQIESKVSQLNLALAQVKYNSGTFMRLEPREVNDREIAEFRRSLAECLDESLENTSEANEARFLRIKKLVERLADKDNATWRDKVIDVRRWYDFAAREIENDGERTRSYYEDSAGQSGGEKAKLAFTILVAAIAYQYDLDPTGQTAGRFHFVVVDEMFSKVDDQNAEYALQLFEQFGLQLLVVAPLDSKARVTEPFVDCYLHAVKDEKSNRSQIYSMTAREYEEVIKSFSGNGQTTAKRRASAK